MMSRQAQGVRQSPVQMPQLRALVGTGFRAHCVHGDQMARQIRVLRAKIPARLEESAHLAETRFPLSPEYQQFPLTFGFDIQKLFLSKQLLLPPPLGTPA